MAYWIEKTGGSNNSRHRDFRADYLSDVEGLPTMNKKGVMQEMDTVSCEPCSFGSTCLCLEDGSRWILSKATDEWKKIGSSSGTSSGGSSDINPEDYIEPIPEEDILSMF